MDVQNNASLAKYSTLNIGGKAELFCEIKTLEELDIIVKYAEKKNIKITPIGKGSNILISDKGIKGLVIKMSNSYIYGEGSFLTVGSGTRLWQIAKYAQEKSLSGAEFLIGIPGTLGGGIISNAGAHGRDLSNIVKSVIIYDYNNGIHELTNEEIEFAYRKSIFRDRRDCIIAECKIELRPESYREIANKMLEFTEQRKIKQPIKEPNAGSVFKNPKGFSAGKLIEEVGAKGWTQRGAKVSEHHANFIVNTGNATAKDVCELINRIKKRVKEKKGVELELEIVLLGEEFY